MGVDFANVCFYIGGDKIGYQSSHSVLETMGRKAFYVGEIGTGQSVKLLTNLLFYAATAVWAELLVLARANEIPLHWFWDFVKTSRGNCFVSNQLTPFMLDASYDHSCTLEITVKDMSLTEALADELGVAMPLGRIIADRYRQAGARFDTQDNHVKVAALSEQETALRLRWPTSRHPRPTAPIVTTDTAALLPRMPSPDHPHTAGNVPLRHPVYRQPKDQAGDASGGIPRLYQPGHPRGGR